MTRAEFVQRAVLIVSGLPDASARPILETFKNVKRLADALENSGEAPWDQGEQRALPLISNAPSNNGLLITREGLAEKIAAEREACAQIAAHYGPCQEGCDVWLGVAEAIRARGVR